MRYSDSTIDKVRDANDIVDVVGQYVKLTRSGNRYKGLCPFHNEKTPSFVVTPEMQIYKCFGCGKGGNVFTFIQELEKVDFTTAVEMLAERAHIEITPENGQASGDEQRARTMLEINKEAARFYYKHLNKDPKAIDYVRRRGLSNETVKAYAIGAAPESWDSLYKHLTGLGYKDKDILDSKLCVSKQPGKIYDAFRGRLMFPILDIKGRVIAFGGRVYDNSLPKYINSPETRVYTKGVNLFGLNVAKSHAQNGLILVEGYMDCISLFQAGIPNVVASLGTALTEKQARLIAGRTSRVYISYDADGAGQNAIEKAIAIFRRTGIEIRVLKIPGSKDPDEYIKAKGKEAFLQLLDNSITAIEFLVQRLEIKYSPETNRQNRSVFLKETAKILASINSETERELYARQYGNKYQVNYESLLRDSSRQQPVEQSAPQQTMVMAASSETVAMQNLLLAMVCAENACFNKIDCLNADLFADPDVKAAYLVAEAKYKSYGEVTISSLMQDLNQQMIEGVTAQAYHINDCDDVLAAAKDVAAKLKVKNLIALKERLSNELKRPDITGAEVNEINMKIAKLAMDIAIAKKAI
ncbi:MAG: DNA primase [Clostridia bacterium]|nr:DNA primase [Clostridia bacterium]